MTVHNNGASINSLTPLAANSGGSGQNSPTAKSVLVGQGASPFTSITLSNGQLIIGNTSNNPSAANLTASDGINIVNAAASITLNTTPNARASMPFNFMMMGG